MAQELGGFSYEVGLELSKNIDATIKALEDKLKNINSSLSMNVDFKALESATKALSDISGGAKDASAGVEQVKKAFADIRDISKLSNPFDGLSKEAKAASENISALFVDLFKKANNTSTSKSVLEDVSKKTSADIENMISRLKSGLSVADELQTKLSLGGKATIEPGLVKQWETFLGVLEKAKTDIGNTTLLRNDPSRVNAIKDNVIQVYSLIEAMEKLHSVSSLVNSGNKNSVLLSVIPVIDVAKLDVSALQERLNSVQMQLNHINLGENAFGTIQGSLSSKTFTLENVSINVKAEVEAIRNIIHELQSVQSMMVRAGSEFSNRAGKDILPRDFGQTGVEVDNLVKMIRDQLNSIVVNIDKGHLTSDAIAMIEKDLKQIKLNIENATVSGEVKIHGINNVSLASEKKDVSEITSMVESLKKVLGEINIKTTFNPEQLERFYSVLQSILQKISGISSSLKPIADDHINNLEAKMQALDPVIRKVKESAEGLKAALADTSIPASLERSLREATSRMSPTGFIRSTEKGSVENGDIVKYDATATQMEASLKRVMPIVEQYLSLMNEYYNKYSNINISPDIAGASVFAKTVEQIRSNMDKLQSIYSDGEKALDHFSKKQNEAGKESASVALTGPMSFQSLIESCERLRQVFPLFDEFVGKVQTVERYTNELNAAGFKPGSQTAMFDTKQLEQVLTLLGEIRDAIRNITQVSGSVSVAGFDTLATTLANIANSISESIAKINETLSNLGKGSDSVKNATDSIKKELETLPSVVEKMSASLGTADASIFSRFFDVLKNNASKLGEDFKKAFSGSNSWFEGLFNERDGQRFLYQMNEVMIKLGDLRQKSNLGLFQGDEVNQAIHNLEQLWNVMNNLLTQAQRMGTTFNLKEFLANPMQYRTAMQDVNALLGSQRNQNMFGTAQERIQKEEDKAFYAERRRQEELMRIKNKAAEDERQAQIRRAEEQMRLEAESRRRLERVSSGLVNAQNLFNSGATRTAGQFTVDVDAKPALSTLSQLEAKIAEIKTKIGAAFTDAVAKAAKDGTFDMLNFAYKQYHKAGSDALDRAKQLNAGKIAQDREDKKNERDNAKRIKEEGANLEKLNEIIKHQTNLYEQLNNAKNVRKSEDKSVYYLEQQLALYEKILKTAKEVAESGDVSKIAQQVKDLPGILDKLKADINIAKQNDNAPTFVNVRREKESLAQLEAELARLKETFNKTLSSSTSNATVLGSEKYIEARKQEISVLEKEIQSLERRVFISPSSRRNGIEERKEEIRLISEQIKAEEQRVSILKNSSATPEQKKLLEQINDTTAAIERQKQAIADLSKQGIGSGVTSGWSSATNAQKQFDSQTLQTLKSITSLDQQFSMLAMNIQNAFSIIGLQQFAQEIVKIGGELERQQLAMGSIFGDDRLAQSMYNQVAELSMKSPFTVQDLVKNTKQLSAFGVEYDKLYDTTKRLSDIAAAVGVDFGRIAYEYGQMESMGYLDARHLRMFSMSGIPLAQELAKYYTNERGVDVGVEEVRKMMMKRQVSADVVKEILKGMTDEGGKFYNMQEIMAESLASKQANFENRMNLMYGELATSGIGDALKSMYEILTEVAANWKSVGREIIAVTTAMLVGKAVTAAHAAVTQVAAKAEMERYLVASNFTKVEAAKLVTDKELAAIDLQRVATTGNLTKSQVAAMVATSGLDKAEQANILTTRGLTVAQAQFVTGYPKILAGHNLLIGSFARLKMALVSLWQFVLSNPWTVALTAIAALGTWMYNSYKESNKLKEGLHDLQSQMTKDYAEQSTELEYLIKKLNDETASQKEREKVYDKIMSKYGEYFGKLDTEVDKYEAVTRAATAAKEAIRQKLLMQMQEDKVKLVNSNFDERMESPRNSTRGYLRNELKRIGFADNKTLADDLLLDIETMLVEGKKDSEIEAWIRGKTNKNFYLSNLSSSALGNDYGFTVMRNLYNSRIQKLEEINKDAGHETGEEVVRQVTEFYNELIKAETDPIEKKQLELRKNKDIARAKRTKGNVLIKDNKTKRSLSLDGLGLGNIDSSDITKYENEAEELANMLGTFWYTTAIKTFDKYDKSVAASFMSSANYKNEEEFLKAAKKTRDDADETIKFYEAREKELKKVGKKLDAESQNRLDLARNEKKASDELGENLGGVDWDSIGKKKGNSGSTKQEKDPVITALKERYKWIKAVVDVYKNAIQDGASANAAWSEAMSSDAFSFLSKENGFENINNLDSYSKFVTDAINRFKKEVYDKTHGKKEDEYSSLGVDVDRWARNLVGDEARRAAEERLGGFEEYVSENIQNWSFVKELTDAGIEFDDAIISAFGNDALKTGITSTKDWLMDQLSSELRSIPETMFASENWKSLVGKSDSTISDILFGKDHGVLNENEQVILGRIKAIIKEIDSEEKRLEQKRKDRIKTNLNDYLTLAEKLKNIFENVNDTVLSFIEKSELSGGEKNSLKDSAALFLKTGNFDQLSYSIDTSNLSDKTKMVLQGVIADAILSVSETSGSMFKLMNDGMQSTKAEINTLANVAMAELKRAFEEGSLSADDYTKKLREVEEKQREYNEGFNPTAKSFIGRWFTGEGYTNKANRYRESATELRTRAKVVNDINEKKSLMDAAVELEKAADKLDAAAETANSIKDWIGALSSISSIFSALGNNTASSDADFYLGLAGSAAGMAASYFSGDYAQMAQQAIQMTAQVIEKLSTLADEYLEEIIQESKLRVEILQAEKESLKNAVSVTGSSGSMAMDRVARLNNLMLNQLKSIGVDVSDIAKDYMITNGKNFRYDSIFREGIAQSRDKANEYIGKIEEYRRQRNQGAIEWGGASLASTAGMAIPGFFEYGMYNFFAGLFGGNSAERKAKYYEDVVKAYEEAANAIDEARISETNYQKATGNGKVQMNMYSNLLNQRLEIEKQLAAENEKKGSDDDKIKDYEDQIKSLNEEILYFKESVMKDLYDLDLSSWGSNIADAIIDAFASGEDAVKAFEDTVNDMLSNVANAVLAQYIQDMYISKLYDKIFGNEEKGITGLINDVDFFGDPDAAAKAVVGEIAKWRDSEGSNVVDFAETFAMEMQNAIPSYAKDGDSSGSMSSSIKGTTEETSDIIAAYLNGIRLDVSVDRNILEEIAYTHLPLIEDLLGDNQTDDYVDFEEVGPTKLPVRYPSDEDRIAAESAFNNINETEDVDYATMLASAGMMISELTYMQLPTLNATAAAQLAQLNMQTEYLRVIQENTAINIEAVTQMRDDLHSVIYGGNRIQIQ